MRFVGFRSEFVGGAETLADARGSVGVRRWLRSSVAWLLLTAASGGLFAQTLELQKPATSPVIRSTSQEVVLDMIVRDKTRTAYPRSGSERGGGHRQWHSGEDQRIPASGRIGFRRQEIHHERCAA